MPRIRRHGEIVKCQRPPRTPLPRAVIAGRHRVRSPELHFSFTGQSGITMSCGTPPRERAARAAVANASGSVADDREVRQAGATEGTAADVVQLPPTGDLSLRGRRSTAVRSGKTAPASRLRDDIKHDLRHRARRVQRDAVRGEGLAGRNHRRSSDSRRRTNDAAVAMMAAHEKRGGKSG